MDFRSDSMCHVDHSTFYPHRLGGVDLNFEMFSIHAKHNKIDC